MHKSGIFLIRRFYKILVSVAVVIGSLTLNRHADAASSPPGAASVGYNLNTFSSEFTEQTVDLTGLGRPGFNWYPWALFGHKTNTSAIVLNPDHSITLKGDTTGPGGEIVTAAPARGTDFVGTAFGGGAYIEAELKFNPDDVASMGSKGWPAFWSLGLESSLLKNADQWPGQPPGYRHSVEVDILEYLYLPYGVARNVYGAGMHDWFGIPNATCQKGLCAEHLHKNDALRATPTGTDFTQYHRFGFLWVPATASAQGYARFYFDGSPIGAEQRWTQYNNQPPTPTGQPWAFGVLDQRHLILILGTGINEPVTVRSVQVWQASASQNIHQ